LPNLFEDETFWRYFDEI